jgi:hypothetical protein
MSAEEPHMLIAKAPPAAELTIAPDAGELMFKCVNPADEICMATVGGSSNLDLELFNVTATGSVKPGQPGELEIVLLARANDPLVPPTGIIYPEWTAIAHSPAEPIGGSGDLAETMWMIAGLQLMYFLTSGKLQGTWVSNIADNPTTAIDLSNGLIGLKPKVDPVMMFAVSAIFTPTTEPIAEPYPVLSLASLSITGEV